MTSAPSGGGRVYAAGVLFAAGSISTDPSRATVRIIRTDEERMVAGPVWRVESAALEGKAPPRAGQAIEGATA